MAFLSDMERLGEAVERACRQSDPAFRRVNLEILGMSTATPRMAPTTRPRWSAVPGRPDLTSWR
jgi:hypothetical protein